MSARTYFLKYEIVDPTGMIPPFRAGCGYVKGEDSARLWVKHMAEAPYICPNTNKRARVEKVSTGSYQWRGADRLGNTVVLHAVALPMAGAHVPEIAQAGAALPGFGGAL